MRVGVTADNDLANSLRHVAIEGTMDGLAVGEVVP
jgi:hypothetical protein